jgi:hypothetical protein
MASETFDFALCFALCFESRRSFGNRPEDRVPRPITLCASAHFTPQSGMSLADVLLEIATAGNMRRGACAICVRLTRYGNEVQLFYPVYSQCGAVEIQFALSRRTARLFVSIYE